MSAESSGAQAQHRGALATLILGAAAVLLLLRLFVIGVPALWIDEAFSLYHARLPLAQLWGEGWRLESSPPLYYTALWAWIRIAADSEASSRLFSLLLTAVAAVFVYRGARCFAGPTAGAVAVLVWFLPALGLEFSLEIRPYALQQCLIAIAVSAFAGLLSAWSRQRSLALRAALVHLTPIVLACTAAFYTHTTSLVFICSLATAALYFGWVSRAGVRFFQIWVAACIVLLIFCLPQIYAASGVLATNRPGLAWIPSSFDPVTLSRLDPRTYPGFALLGHCLRLADGRRRVFSSGVRRMEDTQGRDNFCDWSHPTDDRGRIARSCRAGAADPALANRVVVMDSVGHIAWLCRR